MQAWMAGSNGRCCSACACLAYAHFTPTNLNLGWLRHVPMPAGSVTSGRSVVVLSWHHCSHTSRPTGECDRHGTVEEGVEVCAGRVPIHLLPGNIPPPPPPRLPPLPPSPKNTVRRLMIETDAPYLVPRTITPSKARPGRNEPALLPHVLKVGGGKEGGAVLHRAVCVGRGGACSYCIPWSVAVNGRLVVACVLLHVLMVGGCRPREGCRQQPQATLASVVWRGLHLRDPSSVIPPSPLLMIPAPLPTHMQMAAKSLGETEEAVAIRTTKVAQSVFGISVPGAQ